jgi:hypothetical protein
MSRVGHIIFHVVLTTVAFTMGISCIGAQVERQLS